MAKNLELVNKKRSIHGIPHTDFFKKSWTKKMDNVRAVKDCEGCQEEISLALQYSTNQKYEVVLEVKGIHLFLKVKELVVS